MKLNVWLDDVRPPGGLDLYDWGSWHVWVRTADAALALIRARVVGSISLDHDLGDGVPDGNVVACEIERMAVCGELSRIDVRVHSMNPAGRERMEAAIRSANIRWEGMDERA